MTTDIQSLFSTALRLHQAGQLADAEQIYRQILAQNPRHADSIHLLGMVGYQSGHSGAAIQLIQQAIAINPKEALYHCNLGVILSSINLQDDAVQSYRRALERRPDYVEAHSNLANVLVAQRQYAAALPHFERVLEMNPNHADTHTNLGVALAEQGNFSEAVHHYERAIALNPKCAEAFSNLGNALQAQGKLQEAIECYERALSLKPNYLTALYNLGNVYQALDQMDDAFECYDRALAFQPDYAFATYGKALGQLLQGDFVEGWANYESRWKTVAQKPFRKYPQPRWNGQPIDGNVLLWGEQGIGDEIMFAGLIPEIVQTGTRCILDCDARLHPIFARSFPDVKLISNVDASVNFAAHQPLGSLPGLFRKCDADFAATKAPYLQADSGLRIKYRSKYQCGRRLVGLAWHTSNLSTGPSRCIELAAFAPLFERNDISWISLQYGKFDDLQRAASECGAPLLIDRTVDQFTDMDSFAAQIAALDLVITIDNSTAHLAAALGVPVWLLLPFARDWRWQQNRTDSPWYPTVRLFRQPTNGDWKYVLEQVNTAIASESLCPASARALQELKAS